MVVVLDTPESIRQLLWTHWALHGSLSKDVMGSHAFNTGVPGPSRKYPSVEVVSVDEIPKVLSLEWWQQDPLVHIHVWVRPRTTTPSALAAAKNDRRYMVQQIYDIIHKYQTQAIDHEWLYPQTEICADQYHAIEEDVAKKEISSAPGERGQFPILHTIIPVRARRFHNAMVGGFQINR